MLATERLLEIEEAFSEKAQSIVPLELDGETLRLILYLKDGTNLRVTEQWQGHILIRTRTWIAKLCAWLYSCHSDDATSFGGVVSGERLNHETREKT